MGVMPVGKGGFIIEDTSTNEETQDGSTNGDTKGINSIGGDTPAIGVYDDNDNADVGGKKGYKPIGSK